MPKNASINMRIDPEFKKKVEKLFSELGLSTTEAINIFLHQSVLQDGIPFEVKNYKKINYFADLYQSIEQLEQGKIVIKTIDELEEMEN
ncbi:MAG: type II toxin-antitoxin system RelB/DinJ family antitoxin [Actinobacteria bacterium]|nr:type II toxin-antitoxin system RelB/DinJ family antitoxin [Actinomycetota bacterium]